MDWVENVNAVLVSWFGGQGMSDALVDVVLGDCEPSGRANDYSKCLKTRLHLRIIPGRTVRFYTERESLSGTDGMTQRHEVAFPFGHGLTPLLNGENQKLQSCHRVKN